MTLVTTQVFRDELGNVIHSNVSYIDPWQVKIILAFNEPQDVDDNPRDKTRYIVIMDDDTQLEIFDDPAQVAKSIRDERRYTR